MPLSRRKVGEAQALPAGVLNRTTLSPFRVRQAGIATHAVGYRRLVREIETVGTVATDERRLARITARVAGRVEELFVDFTGTHVEADAPLAALYSPDLLTTQEEYLIARRAVAAAPAADGRQLAGDAASTLAAARRRLELWGVSDHQIARLDATGSAETTLEILSPIAGTVIHKPVLTGQYVHEGTVLYTVADLSRLWVLADVHEDDAGLVALGQRVELITVADPGTVLEATVAFVDPVMQSASRTVRMRLDVANPDGKLRPGQFVTARLQLPLGAVSTGAPAAPVEEAPTVWWGC